MKKVRQGSKPVIPPTEEEAAGAVNAALNAAQGAAEDLGAFFMAETFHGGEQEYLTELLWQGGESALEFLHVASPLGTGVRRGLGADGGGDFLLEGARALPLPGGAGLCPIPTEVEGDLVEPGGELRAMLIFGEGLPGAHEGVLANFPRVFLTAKPATAETEEARLMLLHDPLKGFHVSCLGGADVQELGCLPLFGLCLDEQKVNAGG